MGDSVTINYNVGDPTTFTNNVYTRNGSPQILTLGEGWTVIDSNAFSGFQIESLTLPESMVIISSSAFKDSSLNEIIFTGNSSLTTIGQDAFKNAYFLSNIVLPSGVTAIDSGTFNGVRDLTSIIIPSAVTSIGEYAFANSLLLGISFEDNSSLNTISNYAFYKNVGLTTIHIPSNTTTIGNYTFSESTLQTITFDNSSNLLSFGTNAFQKSNILNISIPSSVTNIGSYLFADSSLNEISFQTDSSLNTIGDYAFSNILDISSITIPSVVTSLGDYTFNNTGIREILFNTNLLTTIGEGTFNDTTVLSSIEIPSSIETIGSYGFKNSSLTDITFASGSNLNSIGTEAFINTNITTITIPNQVTTIENSAFKNTSQMISVLFENVSSLATIKANAFENTLLLTTITIPSSVVSIGDSAFIDSSLNQIIFADNSILTTMGNNVFKNTDLNTIDIPYTVTSIGSNSFENTTSLLSVNIYLSTMNSLGTDIANLENNFYGNTNALTISLIDEIIIEDINGTKTATFSGSGELSSFNIIQDLSGATSAIVYGYTSIATSTFKDTNNLTSVVLNDSISNISNGLFEQSGLTSITISSNVTQLSDNAFKDSSLNQIIFTDNSSLIAINANVFMNTYISTISIPSSVTFIGSGSFKGTLIETITLPNGITTIESNTFQNTSSLTNITINNTTDFTSIDNNAFDGASSLTTINIPLNITSINDNAFIGSGITNVNMYLSTIELLGKTIQTIESDFFGKTNVSITLLNEVVLKDLNNDDISDVAYFNGNGTLIGATNQLDGATEVYINNYTAIGHDAFASASGLTTITIPKEITDISDNAFTGSGITNVNMYLSTIEGFGKTKESLETIFFGKTTVSITLLNEVVLKDLNNDNTSEVAYFNGNGTLNEGTNQLGSATEVYINGYTTIGDSAFANASDLTTITIPQYITDISDNAFTGSGITNVNMYLSTIRVLENTLYGLSSNFFGKSNVTITLFQESIIEDNGVSGKTIYLSGSGELTNITQVDISDATIIDIQGYHTVGENAFTDITTVLSLLISYTVVTIKASAFNITSVTSVSFDNESLLSSIGDSSFRNTSISNIIIPRNVLTIGKSAFSTNTLTSVLFKEGSQLTTIGDLAFNGTQIASITIPKGVVSIKSSTFSNNSSLTTLLFEEPSSLTNMGANIISTTPLLTSITIPTSIIDISDNAFSSSSIDTVDMYLSTLIDTGNSLSNVSENFYGKIGVNTVNLISESFIRNNIVYFSGSGTLESSVTSSSEHIANNNSDISLNIQGYSVLGDSVFKDNSYLKSLTISNTVTDISDNAFMNTNLSEVIFEPDYVLRTIGNSAFKNNIHLSAMSIPNTVTSIGNNSFESTKLNTITIPSGVVTIGNNVFNNITELSTVIFDDNSSVTSIGLLAFGNTQITTINIPLNITTIQNNAFPTTITNVNMYYSTIQNLNSTINSLTDTFFGANDVSIVLYDEVIIQDNTITFAGSGELSSVDLSGCTLVNVIGYDTIGNGVFKDKSLLDSIYISFSITSISNEAFNNSGLTTISFENGSLLANIGDSAFMDTSNLQSVIIPSGVTQLNSNLFKNSSINSITLSSQTTVIGDSAFMDTSNLSNINIPSSVTSINNDTFNNSGLTTISFEEGTLLTSIGDSAFMDTSNLQSVIIPSGVTQLNSNLFKNSSINSITLSSQTTVIGDSAFMDTSNLTHITIPSSVTSINNDVFNNSGLTTISFEEGTMLTSLGDSAFENTSNLQSVIIPSGVTQLNSSLFKNSSINSIILSSQTTVIGDSTFNSTTNLSQITIPSSVTSINNNAFTNSSLADVNIYLSSIRELDNTISGMNSNFYGDDGVTITLLNEVIIEDISGIKTAHFSGSGKLINATSELTDASSVVIQGYNAIGENAFKDSTTMQSITIQSSVIDISNNAFSNSGVNNVEMFLSTIQSSGKTLIELEEDFYGRGEVTITLLNEAIYKTDDIVVFSGFGELTNATNKLNGRINAEIRGYHTIGAEAFKDSSELVSIKISPTVTNINSNAFMGSGINNVFIHLSSIENNLNTTFDNLLIDFYGKPELNTITLLNEVIYEDNNNITSVKFAGNGELIDATKDLSNNTIVNIQGYTSIGNNAFYDASNVTQINMPSTLTTIGNNSFAYMSSLYSIIIPSSVTSIGSDAFKVSSINTVTLYESTVNSLNVDRYSLRTNFYGITDIDVIIFSIDQLNVTVSGRGIFKTTSSIGDATNVTIEGYTDISGGVFKNTKIMSMNVLSSVETIGVSVFEDSSLNTIIFANDSSLNTIGDYAFKSTDISMISIPDNVVNIGIGAFSNSNIETITFSENSNFTTISDSMFENIVTLEKIVIPNNVTQIGNNAFKNTGLSIITFLEDSNLSSIGDYAFQNTDISLIEIPENVTFMGIGVLSDSSLNEIRFAANSNLTMISESMFENTHTLESISIPTSITKIGDSAFKNSGLMNVSISSTIEEIGISAFENTPLTSVTFSDDISLNTIGDYAFKNTDISFIEIPDGISRLGEGLFSDSSLNTIIIPSTVTTIGDYAFKNTLNLETFTLADRSLLNSIGQDAFNGSGLTEINMPYNVIGYLNTYYGVHEVGEFYGNTEAIELNYVARPGICFPKYTPITTDQGIIPIYKLKSSIHTIRGKKIVAITQSRPFQSHIVSINKDALGKNIPCTKTEISKNHKVFYKGHMIKARNLVGLCEGVNYISYNGDILYNVLLETHDMMMINNLICETLNPTNIMAKIYGGKYSSSEQSHLSIELTKIIEANDVEACKKFCASV